MVKKRCDFCSGFEGYPMICNYCHSPIKPTIKSSKKNNYYLELEFMLSSISDEEIRKNISRKISTDYLRVIIDHTDIGRIHYRDKLDSLCFKIFHIEYERQVKSIKESLPKNKLFEEDTIDGIKELAHVKAKDYLEITIINMIKKVKNRTNKKRENLKNKKKK